MTTIARQASLRIADRTAPLAGLVTKALANAEFEAIVADIDFATVTIDGDQREYDFDCQICCQGADYLYARQTEHGEHVEACETCVDTYRLAYAAD